MTVSGTSLQCHTVTTWNTLLLPSNKQQSITGALNGKEEHEKGYSDWEKLELKPMSHMIPFTQDSREGKTVRTEVIGVAKDGVWLQENRSR